MSDVHRIAVIGGTGAEGSGLVLRLAAAGHDVTIGSRDAERARGKAAELNALLADKMIGASANRDAAAAADIVILTVPYSAQSATVEEIRDLLQGKILIDATVPLMPPKVSRVQLPADGSAVAAIQKFLGSEVRVVSAFQNVSAHRLMHLSERVDCDVLICGDDVKACETVIALAAAIGLRGIYGGPIANSAAAEALTSLLIAINRRYKIKDSGIRITGLPEQ